jgi:hypothetical protein
MTSLQELERLEYRAVAILSRRDLSPEKRGRLGKMLGDLRTAKAAWLRDHPEILRKVGTQPLDRDKPNARHPDGTLRERDTGLETRHFRAPTELAGLSIATCRGVISVPPSGVVEVNAAHSDLIAELKGRQFSELRDISSFGKAVDGRDLFGQFRPDRLERIVPSFAGGQR